MADRHQQKTIKTTAFPFGVGIFLCSLALPGMLVAAEGNRVEKTFEVALNPRVTISNPRGQILVRGWDKQQVHIVCSVVSPRVEVDSEAIPPSGPADKVHFSTHILDPLVPGKDQMADYSLDVPMGTDLEIRDTQGSVKIERLQGDDATVETVGAPLRSPISPATFSSGRSGEIST